MTSSPLIKPERQGVSFALIGWTARETAARGIWGLSESRNLWDSAVRAEGTEHNFRISIHNSWDEKSRNLWNWSTIYETAPRPFPSFPVQRPIWRAGPDSAIPWPPDSNLVPQITIRIRRQSQKLRINPEIVQQESHLFSMSPSPTNYGLPTQASDFALVHWTRFAPISVDRRPQTPENG